MECTPWLRQQNSGQVLEQSFCREFPPVSASFRHAERRRPAAAVHVEMIDIVDESEAPDCCRQFPPFAPFPPVVFLSHPKGGLHLTRRHGACPLEQGADDRGVGDGPASFHRVGDNRGGWRSSSGWCGGDAEEIAQHLVGGAEQAIVMGEFAVLRLAARRLSGGGHLSILLSECRQG